MVDDRLRARLSNVPEEPGVYLMKDHQGAVVYVGKAVNLRARVRSYFTRSSDGRAFIPLLDEVLSDLETVVVSSEKEALLLENELIKKHQPRFNVRLRDDKNFICLRLDERHRYPRLEVVRRFARDGAQYFGPYSSASSIRETLRLVNRHFQLRTCSDRVLESRRRPCLLHQIGRCPAPCVFEVPEAEYRQSVEDVVLFLRGQVEDLTRVLRERIRVAAGELKFEHAARLRDQLRAVERSLERQAVVFEEPIDLDVFGVHREGPVVTLYVLFVRRGRSLGGRAHVVRAQFPDAELVASYANLYYADGNPVPDEVLLPESAGATDGLEEVLAERRGKKVRVHRPRRGARAKLVQLACRNAELAGHERGGEAPREVDALAQLQAALGLAAVPRHIECFDISHLQGSGAVASAVVALDGELAKSRYRRFRLKTGAGNDDFAHMYEVVSRRLRRAQEEGDVPQLLVIDGGRGQLSSALAAVSDAQVVGVEVVALAKSRDVGDERRPERVFLPNRKDPVVLKPGSSELLVLTRLRDEAHRFALDHQRRVRRQASSFSELDGIPGVGGRRKQALLAHFGSAQRVKEASVEQLAEVAGVSRHLAERIASALRGRSDARET